MTTLVPGQAAAAPAPLAAPAPTDQPAGAPAPAPGSTPADLAPAPAPAPERIEPTGNAALDLALEQLAKAGVSPKSDLYRQAEETGDFTAIRALLAATPAGKEASRFVDIAEQAVKAEVASAAAAKAERAKAIYAAAGGEENWKQVRDWATAQATPEERQQINEALNAGSFVAKLVAGALAQKFAAVKGGRQEQAQGREALPDTAARATQTVAPLSPQEYQRELAKLVSQRGITAATRSPEYQQLNARRAAWRG